MKKILSILLVAVVTVSCLFAAGEQQPIKYDYLDMAYQPMSSRALAMGGAAIAAPTAIDSFITNPSALGLHRFGLSVPSFSLTVFNIQKLVSDEEVLNTIYGGEAESEDYIGIVEKMVGNLGSGVNELMQMDAGVSLALGSIGFGTNVQMKVNSYSKGSANLANIKLIPEFNFAQSVALGIRVIENPLLSLDVGVSADLVLKTYFDAISGSMASKFMDGSVDVEQLLIWDTPVSVGYALPVNVGATVGLLNDWFRLSVTANNINGTYHMQTYNALGGASEEEGAPADYELKTSEEFTIETPWTLNFGAAFTPDIIFNPVVTLDLVDMLGMVQSGEPFAAEDLLSHLCAGAELDLYLLKLRAGIDRGYASIGAKVNLLILQIEASYGWKEFGKNLGDKPVDALTLRFNLGIDK